jgi:hypothetical protein
MSICRDGLTGPSVPVKHLCGGNTFCYPLTWVVSARR